MEGSIKR